MNKKTTTHREHASPVAHDLLHWTIPRIIGAGYGLFSRKAANPRWPEFMITAFVLKKYRAKSSFWFMVRNAVNGMRKHTIVAGDAKTALAKLTGSRPKELFRLSGIYRAVRDEKGPAVATAAIVEIVRITNQKRIQKLTWWRSPGSWSSTAPAARKKHKSSSKTRQKKKTRR